MNHKLIPLMSADVNSFTSDRGIKIRRILSPFLKILLKIATPEKIIVEKQPNLEKDKPYIFVATHGFTNDIIACLASIHRSAYLLIGSTDQIKHNKLMYFAWMNGFIYVDRMDKKSRHEALDKMERILKSGSSVLIFPEGGHNNTENSLCNRLFSSPYILSKKNDIKVVPIAPFYEFGKDRIYINFGEPIDLFNYENKEEALLFLRDTLATMVYENIIKYSTPYIRPNNEDIHLLFMEQRKQEYLKNPWTRDVWNEELTRYLSIQEREYEQIIDDLDNIFISKNNASIFATLLVKRMEQKRYNFKDYMHRNWDKKASNTFSSQRSK